MIYFSLKKKAISFFSLIAIFSIVLFSFLIIVYVSPTKSVTSDIDFGKSAKDIDIVNHKLFAEQFFLKEEIDRSLDNAKFDFSKSYGVVVEEQIKIVDKNCRYNKIPLWYNEQNIMTVNLNEIKDESIPSEEIENSLCIPKFKENSKELLEQHLKQTLSSNLEKDLSPLRTKYSPKVDISNQKDSKLKVDISISYEEMGKISNVKKTSVYTYYYDISSYSLLLESITLSLPLLSEKLKEEVPSCIENFSSDEAIEDKELECIKKISYELFNENFIELGGSDDNFNQYDIEIYKLNAEEDESLKGYYAFKIVLFNKNTKSNEVEFGMILKDTIPTSAIDFNLEEFSRADNTLKVRIFEPKESLDINSYIILYSEEDFLNIKSYASYQNLIDMLKSNQVPTGFEQAGFYDEGGVYYFSKEQSDLNLNLVLVNKNNFALDENSKLKYKDVKLYQIYNFKEKKWALLENKPVYVYVFSTDENKNYDTKNLNGKSISITPKKIFGPYPLLNEIDTTTIDTISEPKQVNDIENSFSFEISNYQDLSFNHYDIYIMKNSDGKEIKEKCLNVEFEFCKYYDGKSKLTQQNGKFLVTSNLNVESKETFENKVVLDFNLEPNIEYEIIVVPVDSFGKGILNSEFKEFDFRFVNNHYVLEEKKQRLQPKVFKLILKDNTKPNPTTSINLLSNKLNYVNDDYYLQWSKVENDITGVYVAYQAYAQGTLKSATSGKLIDLSGNLQLPKGIVYDQIVVSKIIPVDSSGNKEDIMTYNGGTYSATYP